MGAGSSLNLNSADLTLGNYAKDVGFIEGIDRSVGITIHGK